MPGLAVGGVLSFLLGAKHRIWRDPRDAEFVLGAPVLGVVPEYGLEESVEGPERPESKADFVSGDV